MTDEDVVREYRRLCDLVPTLGEGPGRTTTAGWDLEYASADSLVMFLDQIVFRRLNDFVADTPDPLILDCGANIGYTALHYKRQYPGARIVAFEPDPLFAPMLRRNLARNGAADAQVVEAAAWIANGSARWCMEGKDGSHLAASVDAGRNVVDVRTVDLLDYLDEPVDLLKLDIEGAEFDVVPHLAPRLGAVKNLAIECHLTDQSKYRALARTLTVLADAGFAVSVNSYGPWRDLTRRHVPPPGHSEQYLLVAAWRSRPAGVADQATLVPYTGLQAHETLQRLNDIAVTEANDGAAGRLLARYVASPEAFEVQRLTSGFRHNGGFCWTHALDFTASGDSAAGLTSAAVLLENDRVLGPAHALHDDIRTTGGGCFSHWGSTIYLSASDNSDPNRNGRTYLLLCPRS